MNNPARPRILHIASGDLWAGAEVQLNTLAQSLHHNSDLDVFVVLLNHGTLEKALREAGVNVHVIDESITMVPFIIYRLVKIILSNKINIVHTHRTKENILGAVAALLCARLASLRTVHGMPEHSTKWWHIHSSLIQLLDRLSGSCLQHRIISVTDDMATYLVNVFQPEKVRVIQNGINIDAILQQLAGNPASKGNGTNEIRLGLAGRLVPVKRVDMFLETARYISDHFPRRRISYYILGDGPMRRELEGLSKMLGLTKQVIFEGHTDDIYRELQELDILLMTSDHEGLPMVLLEAMVVKTPVIAHAVGGIPRLLDNGACGELVHDHTPVGYATAVNHLLEVPEKRMAYAQSAFERVKSQYSAEANSRAYCNVYKSLLGLQ